VNHSPSEESLAQAALWIDAGEFDRALVDIHDVLRSNPHDEVALCLAAHAYLAQGNPQTALPYLTDALALSSENDQAWRLISTAHFDLGDLRRAIEASRNAQAIDPANHLNHIQAVRAHLGAPKVAAEAWTAARAAVHVAPHDADAHLALAAVALRARKWTIHEASLREALKLDPNRVSAQHDLSTALLRRGKPSEAVAGYLNVLSQDPTMEAAATNLRLVLDYAVNGVAILIAISYAGMAIIRGIFKSLVGDTTPPLHEVTVAVVIVITIVIIATWIRLRRSFGGRLGIVAASLRRTERGLFARFVLISLAYVCLLVALFLPSPVIGIAIFPVWILTVAAGIITGRRNKRIEKENLEQTVISKPPSATP
jgi:tetratricopeptide (TPR) repeat protein